MDKVYKSAEAATADIHEGAVIMSGGFGLSGNPENLIRALRERGVGNLTIISHLCGTPHLPDLRGRILLLEEVNEAPYRIDRMLTQLRLAGVLQGVAGIVVGDCAPGGDPLARRAVRVVLQDRLGDLDLPVVLGAPVGHGSRNLALPLGVPAVLDADQGTLIFED